MPPPISQLALTDDGHTDVPREAGLLNGLKRRAMSAFGFRETSDAVNDEVQYERTVVADTLAVLMGTARFPQGKRLPKEPFCENIPAGFMGADTGLECALIPHEKTGQRGLIHRDLTGNHPVELQGRLKVVPAPNGFCRRIGMHAEGLDANARFDDTEVSKLLTMDDPITAAIIRSELWRISLFLAKREIFSRSEKTATPNDEGIGLLHRAIHHSHFRDVALNTTKIALDSFHQPGYSFQLGAGRYNADDQSNIWLPTLPDYKQIDAAENDNVYWYQVSDGACWPTIVEDIPGTAIIAHAGDVINFPNTKIPCKGVGVPHAWVSAAITADNDDIPQTFDRAAARDKILVSGALSNTAILAGKFSRRANYYNHPRGENTKSGLGLQMVPAFPAESCQRRVSEMLLGGVGGMGLLATNHAPAFYEDLRARVIDPYLMKRRDLNKGDLAKELPRTGFSSGDVTALKSWLKSPEGPMPLDPHRAIGLDAFITKLVEDRAREIYAIMEF